MITNSTETKDNCTVVQFTTKQNNESVVDEIDIDNYMRNIDTDTALGIVDVLAAVAVFILVNMIVFSLILIYIP